jgi:putative ABC transport system permease protein
LDERLERGHVTVISQSAARLCLPGEDPIGKHWQVSSEDRVNEVVGVVGDTRWSVSQPMRPTFYEPLYGAGQRGQRLSSVQRKNVETLAVPVEKILGRMDPDLSVGDVMTLRETIGKSTIDSQFDSILVLAFAVIALLLAAAGLYGVLAYPVTQRTGEIGIRIALGAQRGRVLRVMLDAPASSEIFSAGWYPSKSSRTEMRWELPLACSTIISGLASGSRPPAWLSAANRRRFPNS